MKLLKNLFVFLLLVGFYAPSYAAVSDVEFVSCGALNDANGNGGNKKEGDNKEEPDCE